MLGTSHSYVTVFVLKEHDTDILLFWTMNTQSMLSYLLQGTVKQVLSCGEHEGRFIALTVSGHFLAAGTDRGLVKIWDLSRRYLHAYNHTPGIGYHIIIFATAGKRGFTKDETYSKMGPKTWK